MALTRTRCGREVNAIPVPAFAPSSLMSAVINSWRLTEAELPPTGVWRPGLPPVAHGSSTLNAHQPAEADGWLSGEEVIGLSRAADGGPHQRRALHFAAVFGSSAA